MIQSHKRIELARCAMALVLVDLAGSLLLAYVLASTLTLNTAGIVTLLWGLFSHTQRLYRRKCLLGGLSKQLWKSAIVVGLVFAVIGFFSFPIRDHAWLVEWAALTILWVWLVRIIWHRLIRITLSNGRCVDRAILLVGSPVPSTLMERMERDILGLRFVLTAPIPQSDDAWVEDIVRSGRIDHIYVAGVNQYFDLDLINDLLLRLSAESVPVTLLPDLTGIAAPVCRVSRIHDQPLIEFNSEPTSIAESLLRRLGGLLFVVPPVPMPLLWRVIKGVFDFTTALTVLGLLLPLMLILGLLVRLDGGPALYGHVRIGKDGRRFRCLKFRTMVVNAEAILPQLLAADPAAAAQWSATQKLSFDPRVTKIGRFLRQFSLDELPQLFNVLRGEMSLVGPRPVTSAELLRYGDDAALYCAVRPGITGLWQISGRSNTSYVRRVELDVSYVRTWSLRHDLVILLKTIPVVMARKGAV